MVQEVLNKTPPGRSQWPTKSKYFSPWLMALGTLVGTGLPPRVPRATICRSSVRTVVCGFSRLILNLFSTGRLQITARITPSADWSWHASHNMCNEGFRWKCTRCQGVQAVGGLTPATLERICAHGMSHTSRKRAALDSQAAAGTRSVASFFAKSSS